MKPFLLVLPLFLAAVSARPEAPYVYNRPPQPSFPFPTGGGASINSIGITSGSVSGSYGPPSTNSIGCCGNGGSINIGPGGGCAGGPGGGGPGCGQPFPQPFPQQPFPQPIGPAPQPFPQPIGPAPQPLPNFQPSAPLAPIIQKHIYVHVPPPETEETRPQRIIGSNERPVKHYRIIFIKAPSAPAPTPAQLLAAQQSQEKTLIYVLAKRPDEPEDVLLPTASPTSPSKPEVYFIRYKARQDGNQQIIPGGPSGPGAPFPIQPIDNTGDTIITTNPLIPGRNTGSNGGYQYNPPQTNSGISGISSGISGGSISINSIGGASLPASSYGVPSGPAPNTIYGTPQGPYKRNAEKRNDKPVKKN